MHLPRFAGRMELVTTGYLMPNQYYMAADMNEKIQEGLGPPVVYVQYY